MTAATAMTAAIGKSRACEHHQRQGNKGGKQGKGYPHELTVPVWGQLDVARA
jgi:hypothetical protein